MLHVYRQVADLQRVLPVVLTFKREYSDQFPFSNIRIVKRSGFRWLRRIWNVQIRNRPQLAYPGELQSIRQHLEAEHCSLLHIYFGNNGVFWLPLIRRSPIPVIVSFHGADAGMNVESRSAGRLLVEMFDRCHLILARSDSLASRLTELGCSPAKILVQHTGIPLSTFRYVRRPRPEKGAWQILQACRLIEKKGLRSTLYAFAEFSRRHPHARLTIAGEGPLRDSLEKLAASLGVEQRVFFTGFVDQSTLLTLYESSHLFVHPSTQTADGDREGIPNSLLEAMATGLPCVVSAHGGIPEAVTHLRSGILVRESERDQICQWFERLTLDDALRESIGREAATMVEDKFGLSSQVAKLEDIYLSAAKR